MRTVQMTLDEELVTEVDAFARAHATTRSAFTRKALREALERAREQELEARHREGYARHPVAEEALRGWETEQAWGDE